MRGKSAKKEVRAQENREVEGKWREEGYILVLNFIRRHFRNHILRNFLEC